MVREELPIVAKYLSTIGYGGMLPTSRAGETIAAMESLVGLMFTALSTGLIFARLSHQIFLTHFWHFKKILKINFDGLQLDLEMVVMF